MLNIKIKQQNADNNNLHIIRSPCVIPVYS